MLGKKDTLLYFVFSTTFSYKNKVKNSMQFTVPFQKLI